MVHLHKPRQKPKRTTHKMRNVAIGLVLLLPACGSPVSAHRPIVDMQGVDSVKLNRDMAECESPEGKPFIVLGNRTAKCMAAKGYTVLSADK